MMESLKELCLIKAIEIAREGQSIKRLPKSLRAEINEEIFLSRVPDRYKELISDLEFKWIFRYYVFDHDFSFQLRVRHNFETNSNKIWYYFVRSYDSEQDLREEWELDTPIPWSNATDWYKESYDDLTIITEFTPGTIYFESSFPYQSPRLNFMQVNEDGERFYYGFVFPLSRGTLTMYKIIGEMTEVNANFTTIDGSFNRAEIRQIDALISNMIRPKYRLQDHLY